MKPFDTKGEYSPEEVKAALAGVDGTRQLSYRYERLDRNNKFIENIDYIQACTIENNALADIKRTAKIDVLDTGSMNYLQDRIKPYIRLAMPTDDTYSDTVAALDPLVWWKMDDVNKVIPAQTENSPSDTLAYQTADTAYTISETANTYTSLPIQAGSGTVRQEAWVSVNVTNSDALYISADVSKTDPPNIGVPVLGSIDIYHRTTATGELTLIRHMDIADHNGAYGLTIPYPRRGFYYVKFRTTETFSGVLGTVAVRRLARLEDSSGHSAYGSVNEPVIMKSSPIVSDGGYSAAYANLGTGGVTATTGEDITDLDLTLSGGFTLNLWEDASLDTGGIVVHLDWYTPNGRFYFTRSSGPSMQYHLSASYDDGTVSGTCSEQIYVPSTTLSKGARMTTVTFSPKGIKAYSNGSLIVSVDESSASFSGSDSLYKEALASGYMTIFGASKKLDDVSVYGTALSAGEISKLYEKGTSSVPNRSGFVEWPQGVFVLSSPSRKMVNGNSVVRSVEGYDQLVILKEDSFDYRYAVKAGAKYTDAVRTVLNSTRALEKVTLLDDIWSAADDAEILSERSALFPGNPGNGFPSVETEADSINFRGLSMSAKVTGTSVGYFKMVANFGGADYGMRRTAAGELQGLYRGYVLSSVATYNATTHKYWKVEINADETLLGYFYSADGITWSNMTSVLLVSETSMFQASGKIVIGAETQSQPSTMRVDELVTTVTRRVDSIVVDSTKTLPTALEWEPGTPKIQIINDLLGAINYESATYDENGYFIGRPYVRPQDRTSEFRYATDSESVLTGDVDQTVDLFGVPNKWIVVVSDPDRPTLTGTYVNDNPLSPTSTVSRGRAIVDVRTEQNAPDQVTLDAQASRLAFEASQVYEVIEFTTALMPIHQNADVYDLIIDGLVVDSKYSEHTWSMSLSNGSTMKHKVRKVVSV